MKSETNLFQSIRIRPRREEKPVVSAIPCDWEGCAEPGIYRAPKGHKAEGQYHNFCLAHVRHYNTAFNFFAGMGASELDEALHAPPKEAARPTFAAGQNSARVAAAMRDPTVRGAAGKYGDPFGVFARYNRSKGNIPEAERSKPLHEPDRRALEALGLVGTTKSDDIKKAYKALVKLHHPDANGGDKSSEDRLRAIISAYSHLKKAGFVAKS